MQVKMQGFVVNASAKVDASSNVVKRLQLEVQCDLADIQQMMKVPLEITFEQMQPVFGAVVPERASGKKGRRAPKEV